jgi:hypothetical protein
MRTAGKSEENCCTSIGALLGSKSHVALVVRPKDSRSAARKNRVSSGGVRSLCGAVPRSSAAPDFARERHEVQPDGGYVGAASH